MDGAQCGPSGTEAPELYEAAWAFNFWHEARKAWCRQHCTEGPGVDPGPGSCMRQLGPATSLARGQVSETLALHRAWQRPRPRNPAKQLGAPTLGSGMKPLVHTTVHRATRVGGPRKRLLEPQVVTRCGRDKEPPPCSLECELPGKRIPTGEGPPGSVELTLQGEAKKGRAP